MRLERTAAIRIGLVRLGLGGIGLVTNRAVFLITRTRCIAARYAASVVASTDLTGYALRGGLILKKLLNNPERITYGRLREVCTRHGTEVHAKVRLADVLPIEGSGLPQVLYEFALQAHYDFVVAGADQVPLFAVEFDGPQHAESPQAARDAKKNALSNRLGLPLLRIQAEDLCRDEWQLDRLTEQIEKWFADNPRSKAGVDGMQSNPTCPLCGAAMFEKPSKYGRFLSCTRYPICSGSRDLPNSKQGTSVRSRKSVLIASAIGAAVVGVVLVLFAILNRQDESEHPNCPDCGKQMVVRTNSRTGEPFFGCSDFPTCDRTLDFEAPR